MRISALIAVLSIAGGAVAKLRAVDELSDIMELPEEDDEGSGRSMADPRSWTPDGDLEARACPPCYPYRCRGRCCAYNKCCKKECCLPVADFCNASGRCRIRC